MGHMTKLLLAVSIGLLSSSCNAQNGDSSVNKPIARATVVGAANYPAVRISIHRFARKYQFAVQEVLTGPQGMMEFHTQLFRDDLKLAVSRLKGGQTELFAYPLCSCAMSRQYGLQEAADFAVANLKEELAGGTKP